MQNRKDILSPLIRSAAPLLSGFLILSIVSPVALRNLSLHAESPPPAPGALYGDLSPDLYLTGRFRPERNSRFVSLEAMKLPAAHGGMYLRRETAEALKEMLDAFHRDHPGTRIWITSATRTFYDQNRIWSGKWNGSIHVEGRSLNQTIPDPRKRALKILEYSSMPGTSRHHWGTDFDINVLTNDYYKRGDGAVIYGWLQKNGARFGFCQPYTEGRREGYYEERWHWSYRPLSLPLLHDWMHRFGSDPSLLEQGETFPGVKSVLDLAPLYVKAVGPGCLRDPENGAVDRR